MGGGGGINTFRRNVSPTLAAFTAARNQHWSTNLVDSGYRQKAKGTHRLRGAVLLASAPALVRPQVVQNARPLEQKGALSAFLVGVERVAPPKAHPNLDVRDAMQGCRGRGWYRKVFRRFAALAIHSKSQGSGLSVRTRGEIGRGQALRFRLKSKGDSAVVWGGCWSHDALHFHGFAIILLPYIRMRQAVQNTPPPPATHTQNDSMCNINT